MLRALTHTRAVSRHLLSISSTPTRLYTKMPEPEIISSEEIPPSEAKWVTLKKLTWKDQDGKQRTWECAERKTRGPSGIDAVAILALLQAEGQKTSMIIIEQYRPPIDKYVIEMPAGLIDGNESPEDAAIRELEEETGYKAEGVIQTTPLMVCDPGMTTANMKLVTLRVPVSDTMPEQKLDEGEHIVRRVVPIDTIYDELKAYEAKGFAVDARLAHFAAAVDLLKRI